MFPEFLEDAGLDPFLKAIVGGGSRAELGGIQSFPLTAGAKHEEDGFHANTVGLAGPAAAKAVGVFVFGQQRRDGLPEIIGDTPIVRDGSFVHGRASA
jgi:hypothetical protein